MRTKLEDALEYASYGWKIFPTFQHNNNTINFHEYQLASNDEDVIRGWFNSDSILVNANIGIVTGKVSGFFVIEAMMDYKPIGKDEPKIIEELFGVELLKHKYDQSFLSNDPDTSRVPKPETIPMLYKSTIDSENTIEKLLMFFKYDNKKAVKTWFNVHLGVNIIANDGFIILDYDKDNVGRWVNNFYHMNDESAWVGKLRIISNKNHKLLCVNKGVK